MHVLAATQMEQVAGGNGLETIGNGAAIGGGAGAFGAIVAGATSTLVIGAAATAGALAGTAFGVGWVIGTAIYEAATD